MTLGGVNHGQLGIGVFEGSPFPVQVRDSNDVTGFLTDVVAIEAGWHHSLALKSDGTVWTWGRDLQGELGIGTFGSDSPYPVQVKDTNDPSGYLTDVVAVSGGGDLLTGPTEGAHSLGLKSDGTVWAWGENCNGQLGNGGYTDSPFPVQVVGPDGAGYLTDIVAVAAGDGHSLALKSDGTAWAWGLNTNGQLGIGDFTQYSSDVPVQVEDPNDLTGYLTSLAAVDQGYRRSVALKSDGTVWEWGGSTSNCQGENVSLPVQVADTSDATGFLTAVMAIAGECSHNLALKNNRTVWAWGGSYLGNGTNVGSCLPVLVWLDCIPSEGIPTLTEWGLIIFGVLLLGFITWVFLRRRKAASLGV
jgi:hypothetical protein